MRVVTLVIILLVVGVIGFAGASLYFHWPPVWGWFQIARGYGPAKTPEEAVERFLKAVKDRDYETAADFCTGDYAYELKKCADPGRKLATSIDDLLHNIKLKEINSPKAAWVLNRLQPLPKEFKKPEVKKVNDTTAEFVLIEDLGGVKVEDWSDYNNIDREMFRALSGGLDGELAVGSVAVPPLGVRVPVVKDGDAWKVKLDMTTRLRGGMDKLRTNYGNYVKALDKIKYEIKNHVVTKEELETQLRNEIQSAK